MNHTHLGTVAVRDYNLTIILHQIRNAFAASPAAFCCSVNGGYSYDAEETIPLGGKKELTGTGITLTFAEEFKAGDTYRFSTTAPAVSNSAVLKAVESLYNSDLDLSSSMWLDICEALWASLAASAELFLSLYKRPVFSCVRHVIKGRRKAWMNMPPR